MFNGNMGRIAMCIKFYDGYNAFAEALKKHQWDPDALEKEILASQQQKTLDFKSEKYEHTIKTIESNVENECSAAKVKNEYTIKIAKKWASLEYQIKEYGFDKANVTINLSYLEGHTIPQKDSEPISEATAMKEDLRKSEPLIMFISELETLLLHVNNAARRMDPYVNSVKMAATSAINQLTYKDSLKKLGKTEKEAKKLLRHLENLYTKNRPKESVNSPEEKEALERLKALKHLEKLNSAYGTRYEDEDLDPIFKYLKKGKGKKLNVKNYYSKDVSGKKGNASLLKQGISLKELLTKSRRIKSDWEKRAPLPPEPPKSGSKGSTSSESVDTAPKSRPQTDYASCAIYWKSVDDKIADASPKKVWKIQEDRFKKFNKIKTPEEKIITGEPFIVRIAASEATGEDESFLKKLKETPVKLSDEVEAHLYNALEWADVEKVVIGKDNPEEVAKEFDVFKRQMGLIFPVDKS